MSAERGARGRAYYVTGSVALDTSVFTDEAVVTTPDVMEEIVRDWRA